MNNDKNEPAAGSQAPGGKHGILSLSIKEVGVLYSAYMPFVENGGLFIPTNSSYKLGDEVFMLLNVMGEEEKIPVAGRVIWITPKGAQVAGRTELPRTGVELDHLVAAGLAATAGGAALVLWSADAES